MAKGDQTREMILDKAAQLFSLQGYFGSSLSDIMRTTGLEKGGIYNHFASKEELALEAFDYAVGLITERYRLALEKETHSVERLVAIVGVFRSLIDAPPLPGGCPVLNTAIESDDAQPALRDRAKKAMDRWYRLITRTVRDGIEKGEIRPGVDPDATATIMISTLEGAVMLSKLYRDKVYMHRAVDHIIAFIETAIRA